MSIVVLIGGLDPLAATWRDTIRANGGSVSQRTLKAASKVGKRLRGAGLLPLLFRLNLIAGDQLTAARVPFWRQGGNALEANTGYVVGDYSEPTGLTGGTGKVWATGLVPNTFAALENMHMSVYLRARNTDGTSNIWVGSNDNSSSSVWTEITSTRTRISGATESWALTDNGHLLSTRVGGATRTDTYRNGVIYDTGLSSAALAVAATEFRVLGVTRAGTSSCTGIIAGYSIGLNLTAAQVATFYNILQEFNTTLGRQV